MDRSGNGWNVGCVHEITCKKYTTNEGPNLANEYSLKSKLFHRKLEGKMKQKYLDMSYLI